MFGRIIKMTFRNLKNNLLYTVIVVGGLALGIITFLAIIQWTSWHLSFDRHFPQSENIYRISLLESRDNFERHTARIIHGDVVNQLYNKAQIPEIKSIARLSPFRNAIVRKDDIVFYEDKSYACDNEFLQMFNPKLLVGNIETALNGPNKVILSENTARKYFGDKDPLGEFIEIVHQFAYEGERYEITGIFKSFPANTHFKIELLSSFPDPQSYTGTAWVYLKLQDNPDLKEIEKKVKSLIDENNKQDYSEGLYPEIIPLRDIHLKSHLPREIEKNAHIQTVLILLIAGLLVFVLAWFNFTLLSISQNQLKIKKLTYQWQMGAGKKIFFIQFLFDFLIISALAFLVAIVLMLAISEPMKNNFDISFAENRGLLLLSLSIILFILLASSAATAFYATQKLYSSLKYRYFASKRNSVRPVNTKTWFIRAVIIIEFVITFALVTNLIMIREQVNYSISQQIGSNDSTTIQIPNLPRPVVDKYQIFKEELLKHPNIEEVTAMMEEPGGMAMDAFTYRIEGLPDKDSRLFVFPVDEDFMRFYDLNILAGRDFPSEYNTQDTTEFFMLNETAAKLFDLKNYDELVGRELDLNFLYEGFIYPGDIIGVVEDFHLSNMENEISPMVIFPEYTWLYCISIRFNGNPQNSIEILQRQWKEFFPNYPLQYYFTEEIYENLYSTQLTELKVLLLFSLISILIAGTGLFALSGFFMQQKMHAAAIRKINGARMIRILVPELAQYLVLALISTVIGLPISWLAMHKWLSNFVYQATIPGWIFPSVGFFLIAFSWISVIYHSIRLARLNPIEFIRNE